MPLPRIEVAATVLRRSDGKVLLAQRRRKQIAGGYWELPGGKIEDGETPEQAALRELAEEVGVTGRDVRVGPVHPYDFATKQVRLHLFFAGDWDGVPEGRERQQISWIDPTDPGVPVLPSNERILAALALPSIVAVISVSRRESPADVLRRCANALANGARMIQLRAPYLSPDQRVALARRVSQLAHERGGQVFLVGTAIEANRAGAVGLHSTGDQLRRLIDRPQTPLWSASCHNESDLELAIELGADFVFASPVLSSSGHPDLVPLGWQRLQSIAANAPVPVYAHGGMTLDLLGRAQATGAIGVALSDAHLQTEVRGAA